MDTPIYVLKANEAAWAPNPNAKLMGKIKKIVRIIILVLIAGSLLFGDNLFAELNGTSQVLLIVLFAGTFFVKTNHKVPTPFEIRFYEDRLVLYREKNYYNPKLSRMEFDTFMYKDIKKILYRTSTQRINIYGLVEGKWYNYNKDGSLPMKPSYHKTTDSFSYFYTSADPEVDFIGTLEKYTSIKVIIEEN